VRRVGLDFDDDAGEAAATGGPDELFPEEFTRDGERVARVETEGKLP
jgi:hypothetical protein